MISIVTTAYRSEATIDAFIGRALAAVEPLAEQIELIVVDDGSPDRSAELVRAWADRDPRVVLVQLSRNFGHHRALLTGLEHVGGDLVFLLDSDLDEAPEHLGPMLDQMRSDGADCVYGVQRKRKGGWFERVSGKLFYIAFNALGDVRLPTNVSTMRVMTRRYVRSLLLFRDQNPVFVPLAVITGYRQVPFVFDKQHRGVTTYSLARRLSLLVLQITSFSGRPLSIMFALSLVLSVLAMAYGLVVVIQAIFWHVAEGWPSLMAAILLFFSINALFTGVLGLYVMRILEEVKDRPRSIVQEVYRGAHANAARADPEAAEP
ncbi:MAG: glycosyltransferase family 2 protein [Devosia nanyangense]|uniref:Glycosyltransferase family 2 protein n=1 Tax=Devosia nanyangense TaxID=1228055 RepID=A0A933L0S5_9HYPH|nr:glycosyltransferase family 2 protein [Devosia nanyangense]